MSKKLTDLDRQLISTIEEQMRLLRNKKAPDAVIINTLIDLVPDVKCLVNSSDDAYLKLYGMEYKNFAYFAELI